MGLNHFEVPKFFYFFPVNLKLLKLQLQLRRSYLHLNSAYQVPKNQVVMISLTLGFLLFLMIRNLYLGKGLTRLTIVTNQDILHELC